MTESTRTSALADRHRALGSDLGDWNGMGVAWDYATDPCDEHDAVRDRGWPVRRIGLEENPCARTGFYRRGGSHHTRNMAAIGPGKSAYGPLLTEEGTICDDAIIANMGDNELFGGARQRRDHGAPGGNGQGQERRDRIRRRAARHFPAGPEGRGTAERAHADGSARPGVFPSPGDRAVRPTTACSRAPVTRASAATRSSPTRTSLATSGTRSLATANRWASCPAPSPASTRSGSRPRCCSIPTT